MAPTAPSEVAGANSAAPVAVLVVDGNEDHQILSVAALTRKGWIVRTAGTRKQGLQLALEYHFDAFAIGSKLRDGNGIELLRALGGRLPGTPIILVVPLGVEEAALQAMESGAQSYSVKTPRYNELHPAVVQDHLVEARNRTRRVGTQIEWRGRTYDVHMAPLRSTESAIIGTIGVAFDVSERTRTEESLRRSEERFQLLGRATNDVVWDWDLQTDGMWMNDNVAAMFGYRAEDIEPTGTWWEERLHPDDRGRVGSSVDDLIGTGGSVWSAEYRFRRHDGTYATVVDRGYVLHDA